MCVIDAVCHECHVGTPSGWGAHFGVADKFVLPSTAGSVVDDGSLNLTTGACILEPQVKSSCAGFWSQEAQCSPDPPGWWWRLLQTRGELVTEQWLVIFEILLITWVISVVAVQGDKIVGTGWSISALGESKIHIEEDFICFLVIDELREDPVVLLTSASVRAGVEAPSADTAKQVIPLWYE